MKIFYLPSLIYSSTPIVLPVVIGTRDESVVLVFYERVFWSKGRCCPGYYISSVYAEAWFQSNFYHWWWNVSQNRRHSLSFPEDTSQSGLTSDNEEKFLSFVVLVIKVKGQPQLFRDTQVLKGIVRGMVAAEMGLVWEGSVFLIPWVIYPLLPTTLSLLHPVWKLALVSLFCLSL